MGLTPNRLDLTGQRYGKLTVLRPADNIGEKTAWVCHCDCGKELWQRQYIFAVAM